MTDESNDGDYLDPNNSEDGTSGGSTDHEQLPESKPISIEELVVRFHEFNRLKADNSAVIGLIPKSFQKKSPNDTLTFKDMLNERGYAGIILNIGPGQLPVKVKNNPEANEIPALVLSIEQADAVLTYFGYPSNAVFRVVDNPERLTESGKITIVADINGNLAPSNLQIAVISNDYNTPTFATGYTKAFMALMDPNDSESTKSTKIIVRYIYTDISGLEC